MRKNRLGLIGASVALSVLSLVVMALVRPTPSLATPMATLKVKSSPAGATLASPTCFTITVGNCGTTNWTSTSISSIPVTAYKFPLARSINGINYSLVLGSLTGCNHGVSGSPANICKVSVALGDDATISATYSAPDVATLNINSNPSGVLLDSYNCYTVSSGSCGTTDWTSAKINGIPTTTYKFPEIITRSGVNYALHSSGLSGCNQGISGPNNCKVSVPLGGTASINANYVLAPSCQTNLVQNPSFETLVPNPPNSSSQWGTWPAWQITNSVPLIIPYWTQENTAGIWMFVLNTTTPTWQHNSAFDGSSVAVMNGVRAGWPANGAVNTLSTATAAGSAYDVSAEVATVAYPGSTTYDLRLRNSTTGALSTPITQTVGQQTGQWTLLHGSITANGSYDQVLVRYNGPNVDYHDYLGLVDDVHVCPIGGTTGGGTHWWQIGGGVVLVLAGLSGGLIIWRTRRAEIRPTATGGSRSVADFDGDGKADKIATSGSGGNPDIRGTILRFQWQLALIMLVLLGAGLVCTYIGAFKTKSNSPNNPGSTTQSNDPGVKCLNDKYANDLSVSITCDSNGKTTGVDHMSTKDQPKTPAPAKTCTDKETVASGYKLFRSESYKYCIQYPLEWPVNQTNTDMVTFGAFNPEPTATWFRVTYFSDKSVTTRTDELKASYVEPNGPCVVSDATIATQTAKKFACTGSFNNEIHVYYLVAENSNLFELSYIEGMEPDKAPSDTIYKAMVESFLTDMVANK